MRNHKKVKAIRGTFPNGYAIWSMILEHLTGSDGNVFPYTDLEFELMAGDFGFSVTEIRGVVDYCIKIEMLFNEDGYIRSESLDERLAPVYEKRGKAKELSKKQQRENGKFVSSNTDETGVSVTETPQSKVNKTKGKESKGYTFDGYDSVDAAWEELKNNEILIEDLKRIITGYGFKACTNEHVLKAIYKFLGLQKAKGDFTKRTRTEIRSHLVSWLNKVAKDVHTY